MAWKASSHYAVSQLNLDLCAKEPFPLYPFRNIIQPSAEATQTYMCNRGLMLLEVNIILNLKPCKYLYNYQKIKYKVFENKIKVKWNRVLSIVAYYEDIILFYIIFKFHFIFSISIWSDRFPYGILIHPQNYFLWL